MLPWFKLVSAILAVILLWSAYFWIWRSTRRGEPRFNSEAQRAIGFARVEAEQLQSPTIEPVHLLLGLLHVPVPRVVRTLGEIRRNRYAVLRNIVPRGDARPVDDQSEPSLEDLVGGARRLSPSLCAHAFRERRAHSARPAV